MLKKVALISISLVLSFPLFTYSHEGKKSSNDEIKYPPHQLAAINQSYVIHVKPLFQRTCFDCHSQFTRYPWYSKLPGIKSFIEKDVKEGLKHLDLSKDFPFKGHGTPVRDLTAIEKSIKNNSMPPFSYKVLHWTSHLTEQEKETIFEWIRESLKSLENR